MPKATMSMDEVVEKQLTTCPGGWVKLRKMNYGEWIKRRDMLASVEGRGRPGTPEFRQFLTAASAKVTEFEFATCISDHNLYMDEEETQKIDFKNKLHFQALDARVAAEISGYIDDLTTWQEGDDEGNSVVESEQASS